MHRLLSVLMLALTVAAIALPTFGQDEAAETPVTAAPVAVKDPVPEAFNSPRSTLRTFLNAMTQVPPDSDGGVACLDLAPEAADAAPDLAWQLYKCMNRIEVVDLNDWRIPDAEGVAKTPELAIWTFYPRHSFSQMHRAVELAELAPDARITLARAVDGRWLFSVETMAGIADFADAIKDLNPVGALGDEEFKPISERIGALWPAYFEANRFLGIRLWQWGTLLILIFVGVVLDFTLRFILTLVSRRIIARQGGEARRETIRKTVRPFGLLAAGLFWLWIVRYLGLHVEALKIIMPAVRLFAMLAAVWSAYRMTDLVGEVLSSKAESTDTKFDDLLVPLIRKSIKVLITVFGMVYIAQSMNIGIAPLLTGIGIGGAGFAFAAKDTLEHFFGSITVIADRPFQVGDWVVIGDVEGTVEEVGFRSTRVRTFYNSLMTVPNGNLVRAVVDNFGVRKYRRWKTHLNLTYSTPPEKIEAFCEGIRELIRLHPYTRKDYYQVWLHQFGAHSLDVLVYMFHEAPDWQTELRERHRLMLDIIHLANQLGVEFAFPTQTIELNQHAEPTPPPKPAAPSASTDSQSLRLGRRIAHELTRGADWRGGVPAAYQIQRPVCQPEDEKETQIESKIGGDA